MQDFTAAIERIIAGLEKRNRLLNPREREIVAYHEMGHALVAMALPGVDPVHKVSIIPRGMGALGYTIQRPIEDRFLMTREELENKMAVLLGGRAAEWLIFAHLSTGAADDLAKVTDIARAMVTRYGMSKRLGHLALEREPNSFLGNEAMLGLKPQHDYAESTATAIDEEVQELVQSAFQRSVDLLQARRALLERCARQLLQQETLDAGQLRALSAELGAQLPSPD
jgi:cell division protease FtsH